MRKTTIQTSTTASSEPQTSRLSWLIAWPMKPSESVGRLTSGTAGRLSGVPLAP